MRDQFIFGSKDGGTWGVPSREQLGHPHFLLGIKNSEAKCPKSARARLFHSWASVCLWGIPGSCPGFPDGAVGIIRSYNHCNTP